MENAILYENKYNNGNSGSKTTISVVETHFTRAFGRDGRQLLSIEIFRREEATLFIISRGLTLAINNVNGFIYREERRFDLFLKTIDHVCMSENLKLAVVQETPCKQLKRYMKTYHGMDNTHAQRFADKINLGSCVYRGFTTIVGNFSRFPYLDIRDHTIKELSLAVNLSWQRAY